MNLRILAASLTVGLGLTGAAAQAEDHEAGAPLTPAEGAGAWTLESQGRSLCVLRLGAAKAGADGFGLSVPAGCGDALPAGLVAWTPSADGMRLVGAGGVPAVGFGRWSDSLLVSHRSSGVDVQLRRGGGEP